MPENLPSADVGPDGFRLSLSGKRADLVFDRPPANVLNLETLRRLTAALFRAAEGRARALVLSGKPHFCAGVDIAEHAPEKIDEMLASVNGFLRALLDFPGVTIARVTGACLGGGAEIALAADVRFALSDARIGFPEINLACFPPAAVLLLPAVVGPAKAAELILSGEPVSGREARNIGMVNAVLSSAAELDRTVQLFVDGILSKSPGALAAACDLLRKPRREIFETSLAASEDAYRSLANEGELSSAIEAFQRRKGNRGRG